MLLLLALYLRKGGRLLDLEWESVLRSWHLEGLGFSSSDPRLLSVLIEMSQEGNSELMHHDDVELYDLTPDEDLRENESEYNLATRATIRFYKARTVQARHQVVLQPARISKQTLYVLLSIVLKVQRVSKTHNDSVSGFAQDDLIKQHKNMQRFFFCLFWRIVLHEDKVAMKMQVPSSSSWLGFIPVIDTCGTSTKTLDKHKEMSLAPWPIFLELILVSWK
jgi:hypothetical protein